MANNVSFIIELKDRFGRVAGAVHQKFVGIKNSADAAGKSVATMGERIEATQQKFGKLAIAGGLMSAFVTRPALEMGQSMVDAASDAEETANKFGEVFKGIGGQSSAMVASLTGGYNLATSSAQDLLANTGDLLVGLGLTREKALALSGDVIKLSADVASFKNVEGGTARAADSLTKALLGERDSLKETFKTAVSEEEVKKRAMQLRIRDRTLTERQASALATLAIVTERNKDAIGDLARTSDSYANVSRANQEASKQLSESFGKLLVPMYTKLLIVGMKVATWLNDLSPGMKKFVLSVVGLAAVAGPILMLLAGMSIAFTAISLPVLGVTAAIVALIAVGGMLIANWSEIVDYLGGAWEGLQMMASDAAGWVGEKFSAAWEIIKSGAIAMANFVIGAINTLLGPMNIVRESLGMSRIEIPTIAPTAPTGGASGTINGQIVVSAAPGASVVSTKSQTSGAGLDMGVNMAAAR